MLTLKLILSQISTFCLVLLAFCLFFFCAPSCCLLVWLAFSYLLTACCLIVYRCAPVFHCFLLLFACCFVDSRLLRCCLTASALGHALALALAHGIRTVPRHRGSWRNGPEKQQVLSDLSKATHESQQTPRDPKSIPPLFHLNPPSKTSCFCLHLAWLPCSLQKAHHVEGTLQQFNRKVQAAWCGQANAKL